jgi:SSS family solute:Na+ symporter
MNEYISLYVILGYLCLLITLGIFSSRLFRGTSRDYFTASHSIGPFLLLMSVFGTTMTAFALVGSTGKAFERGIGVYGLMASWSGLVHSAVFFMVGIKLWALGKKHGFVTQCQFFRVRYESNAIGYLLFPILVGLVIPYLLISLLGAGAVVRSVTSGMFPDVFLVDSVKYAGAVPPWLTGLVICGVVLTYIFFGGLRGAVWANTFQTLVFMVTGVIAFVLIAQKLGGLNMASQAVVEKTPELATRALIGKREFLTYCFVPLSVGMFPHLFQHWLTAKSAKTFRLTVIAHPLCIMVVWVPCILIGIWAAAKGIKAPPNAVLGVMVKTLSSPWMVGLLTAGILAAIMSSLDSQFMCLGTMFTNDVVLHKSGADRFSDKQKLWLARGFIVFIVLVTYILSLLVTRKVFDLAVWCFSGFAGLFPLVFASVYWKRTTCAGAIGCIIVTFVVWLILFIQSGFGKEEGLVAGMMPVMFIFIASAVSLVVLSLITRQPSSTTLEKFFPAEHDQASS